MGIIFLSAPWQDLLKLGIKVKCIHSVQVRNNKFLKSILSCEIYQVVIQLLQKLLLKSYIRTISSFEVNMDLF